MCQIPKQAPRAWALLKMNGNKTNNNIEYITELTNSLISTKRLVVSELKYFNCDKYEYCYGDEELKGMVDEIENFLRDNGVLFSTYLLRELFISWKANFTGTITVKVDNELLVKFDFEGTNDHFTINIEKSPNMPELLEKTNYYN